MTLRCSILGHNYGAAEVEREREEDGSEVVTTVRETETCIRCGETRVVSENKEVTTLETAADIVADDPEPEPDVASAPETPDADPEPDVETSIPDAEESVPSAGTPPATDPAEDDGVILEDETDETAERAPGEWPAEPDDDDDEWEPETTPVHDDDPEIERTGDAVTVPEGSFRCPECDFSTDVEASSLRAGDFCPECHRGALEHHPE
ncbi:MAG: hypothetical protein V5A55_05460 [Halovenus sp.]